MVARGSVVHAEGFLLNDLLVIIVVCAQEGNRVTELLCVLKSIVDLVLV